MRSPDAATGAAMFARMGLLRVVEPNRFLGASACDEVEGRVVETTSLGRIGHADAAAAWLSDGPSPARLIHTVRTRL